MRSLLRRGHVSFPNFTGLFESLGSKSFWVLSEWKYKTYLRDSVSVEDSAHRTSTSFCGPPLGSLLPQLEISLSVCIHRAMFLLRLPNVPIALPPLPIT